MYLRLLYIGLYTLYHELYLRSLPIGVDLLATHLQLAAILGTTHDIECRAQYTVVADTFKHSRPCQRPPKSIQKKQPAFC
jgi:hypothetical protein